MRRRRKSDWFAIVATDLFCGALCAVIILDAVSRKAPSLIDGPGRLSLSYQVPAGKPCSSFLVLALIDTAAGEYLVSTIRAANNGGHCVTVEDVPDLTGARLRTMLLAKGVMDLDVNIRAGSVLDVTCNTGSPAC